MTKDCRGERLCVRTTENERNKIYYSYKFSLKHRKYANTLVLSIYYWKIKDEWITFFEISWEILERNKSSKNSVDQCKKCLLEKLAILKLITDERLLMRSEHSSRCRYVGKCLLCHLPRDWGFSFPSQLSSLV